MSTKLPTQTELLVIGYIRVLQKYLTEQIIPDSIAKFCYSFYPQPNDTDDGTYDTLENIIISVCMNPIQQSLNGKSFLLCFPEFTNTMDILAIIMYRFSINASPYSTDTNFASYNVQCNIIDFIQYWIKNYYQQDFSSNNALQYISSELCTKIQKQYQSYDDEKLQQKGNELVKKLKHVIENVAEKKTDNMDNVDAKNNVEEEEDCSVNVETFLGFDSKIFGEQLTLCDFKEYIKIQPREFVNESWKKRVNEGKDAPNILHFIQNSNIISYWMQFIILNAKDLKQRVKVLQKCIEISNVLNKISNYNSLSMMNASYQSTSIYRLKSLWNKLGKKWTKIKDEIIHICSANNTHKNMKELILKNIENKIATVPSMILFLSEISLIYDGMKWKIFDSDSGVDYINYQRLQYIYNHIHNRALVFK
eukprot:276561_1